MNHKGKLKAALNDYAQAQQAVSDADQAIATATQAKIDARDALNGVNKKVIATVCALGMLEKLIVYQGICYKVSELNGGDKFLHTEPFNAEMIE